MTGDMFSSNRKTYLSWKDMGMIILNVLTENLIILADSPSFSVCKTIISELKVLGVFYFHGLFSYLGVGWEKAVGMSLGCS